MSKTGVFTLTGPNEGKSLTILEKYPFTDGVFKTPAKYAPLMARMLCAYYGCVLTYEGEDDEPETGDSAEGSLAIGNTRGLTVGQKVTNFDLEEKLRQAELDELAEQALADRRAAEQKVLDEKQVAEQPVSVEKPAVPVKPAK